MVDVYPLLNIVLRGEIGAVKTASFTPHDFSDNQRAERELTPALDAIASICVSQPQHQVVATSLTFTKDDKSVVLCVAENNDVSEATVSFLKTLWAELKTLSILEKKAQEEHPTRVGNVVFTDAVCDVTWKVYRECYAHSRLKLKRRITKRWDAFAQFFRFWFKNESGPPDLRPKFEDVANALSRVKDVIGDGDVKDEELAEIVRLLRVTRGQCDTLLAREQQLRKWGEDYKNETGQDFPLRHYLQKCYDLDAAISTINGFGLSSRLFHVFERNFVIKPIPCESRFFSYPNTSDRWREYHEMVFNAAEIVNKRDSDALTAELGVILKAPLNTPQLLAPVHSECLLLAYHHRRLISGAATQSEVATPPLNYIGCSKMSCYACTRYFQAYRDSSGYNTSFFTRASHLQRFPPWAMPDLQDPKADMPVHKTFYEYLASDYGEYLEEKGIAEYRTGSETFDFSEMSLFSNEKGEEVYVSVPTEMFGIDSQQSPKSSEFSLSQVE